MRQALSIVPAPVAVAVAYNAISANQHNTPAEQVAGLFFSAYLVAQQLGLSPSELFNQSQRRFEDAKVTHRAEIQAFTDFINKELRA